LRYFFDQHMVEMVDVKTKKVFLKKSSCPKEITSDEFIVGGKVTLYSRELDIVDYGDLKTKEKLNYQIQQCLLILTSQTYKNWGKIITELSETMSLFKVKSVLISQNTAVNVCQIFDENQRKSSLFTDGVNLVLVFNSEDVYNKLKVLSDSLLIPSYGDFFYTINGTQTSSLIQLFFTENYPTSATLDSCSLCLIKPHAVKSKLLGKILDVVISQGYEVSALKSLYFDKIQAEEFLEVYKGVIPDFSQHVLQLTSGLCIALEVRAENAVETFRETAGPWDVEIAAELRPDTIRGKFGIDRVLNAVHCTDLSTDGEMECEYCFKLVIN